MSELDKKKSKVEPKKKGKPLNSAEHEKASRKRRKKDHKSGVGKKIAIVLASIVGVLAIAYIGFGAYFGSHFMFNTKINGTDYSMASAGSVEADMKEKVNDYVLTLKESDGTTEEIKGSDIGVAYESSDEVTELMKKQNNWMWITSLWKKNEIETNIGVTYDENALAEKLQSLNCM